MHKASLIPHLLVVLLLAAAAPTLAQKGAAGGEWRTYGGDLASTRYAPLDYLSVVLSALIKEH